MEANEIKKEWKAPQVMELCVNEFTEGGASAGEDVLEQS